MKALLIGQSILTLLLTACTNQPQTAVLPALPPVSAMLPDDALLASQLIGVWTPDPKEMEQIKLKGETTYRADGTGTELIWPPGNPDYLIHVEFHWFIRNRLLTVAIDHANVPAEFKLPKLPSKLVDKIVSISDRQMIAELQEGYEGTAVKGQQKLRIRKK